MIPASIPSPDQGTWQLGFFELRAYAVCIIVGVLIAVWLGNRRWIARGGRPGTVADVAVWAVPFGLVGARLYHVITDYELYFGDGGRPIEALYIWRGGLGIWGAIALGALGAYIACRRRGVRFLAFADAMAPGIAIAQAVGRWGNWFNQELYGRPTTLPWALEIDPEHRTQVPEEFQQFQTFHPTFLYEFGWALGVAGLVLWADRRFRLGFGRAFALYVMAYTVGRGWIESMRIDNVTLDNVFGLRLNVWTSVIVFIAALAFFIRSSKRHPGREEVVEPAEDAEHAEDAESTEPEEGVSAEAADAEPEDRAEDAEDADADADQAEDEPATADATEPADTAGEPEAADSETAEAEGADEPEPTDSESADESGSADASEKPAGAG
ncbi:MAG: prolipoprotein diacylglyceryl transferase [Propionibacteriales bacterium]|nr:prolipoprotein diacylglyceryl transferase [Propionibacteriales bacterium]